ncbi:cell wall protein DAN4-like [Drosophila subpulchrella]|uniref:cell wall protein DAN4-like n=1 Tax=Drosophila subpulchrella TaxID=1486046 RepID=UPI0018A12F82|nr:cell wall protein DAN4-like [Drosophila subpulchrella]
MDLINKTSDESEIPNLKSEFDTKIFNAINGSINEKDLTTSTSASTVEEETTISSSTTITSTSTTTSTTTPTMRRGILEEEEKEETTTTTAATTLKKELLEEDTTKTATSTTTTPTNLFDFNSENESVDHIENKNIGDEKSEKIDMGINDSEREFENVSRAPTFSNTSQELVLGISDSDTEFESVSRVPIKRNTTHKLKSTENIHNSQIEFTKRGIIENFKQKLVENERRIIGHMDLGRRGLNRFFTIQYKTATVGVKCHYNNIYRRTHSRRSLSKSKRMNLKYLSNRHRHQKSKRILIPP